MAERGRPVSQTLIAEELNLSVPTVSRALRNEPGIHPQTRLRVMEAAAKLRYKPLRGRAVPTPGEQQNVGVFIRSLNGGVRPRFLDGMSQLAASLNVSLILHHSPLADTDHLLNPANQPAALRHGLLNGVVLMHRWPLSVAKYLCSQLACTSIVHQIADLPIDVIDMDYDQGISLLMNRLKNLGHRHIGFVGFNPDVSWSRARYSGYLLSLNELDLPLDPSLVLALPAKLLEDRSVSWNGWMDKIAAMVHQGATALVGASHWVGGVMCQGLIERGISVPGDVSVTGFDDSLGVVGVDLTSIRVPAEEMGAEALRQVLARIADPDRPARTVRFRCALVEGVTTAPPPVHRDGK